jgi:hypothetical protein
VKYIKLYEEVLELLEPETEEVEGAEERIYFISGWNTY